MVAHTCNPRHAGGRGRRIISSRLAQSKVARPYLKSKIRKQKGGGVVQVVVHLPSKLKALVQSPVWQRKKNGGWAYSKGNPACPGV
jgi:hypothetical protein